MEKVLVSAFVAVESAHAFSAFNPSIFTIKSLANQTEEGKAQIREGYIPAVIFSVVLSFIVSRLIKSNLPLYFAVGTVVFMILWYEWALRSG